MSKTKLVMACGLMALLLGACGIQKKPEAGTPHVNKAHGSHAKWDDPRKGREKCLKKKHLHGRYYTASGGRPAIQVGTLPTGPTIIFDATPAGAEYQQILGNTQAAEIIGAALVYPNKAKSHVMKLVENCMAVGVAG
jgi:hypothetical protein